MKNKIPYGRQFIDSKDISSVSATLKKDVITTGTEVIKFEQKIKKYLGVKYTITCNSGTSGLYLAMMSIGIRKNDPVFTLDVNGDINFKGRLLQGGVEISSDDAGQASGTVINAKIVRNKYDEEGLWLGYGNNGSGNNNGDIRFYANNLTERMRIKADTGNVGINATSPRCILDISGSDALVVPVGNTSQRPNYDENNVESSGIVGAIRYNIELDQYEGYGTPFNTAETLTGGYWGSLGGVKDIDRDTFITAEETLDEDKLKFYTSGVQRMVIDPSGNFGIGVTDPSSVLHIFDNSNNSAIFLGETIDNNKSVKIEYTQGDTDVTGNLLLSRIRRGLSLDESINIGAENISNQGRYNIKVLNFL